MYSIIFTAFDKAGNYKSTRSVFLFDDQSVVETTSGTRMIVTESSSETNYTWVVTDTSQLHVKWPGRFMNKRHDVNHWLDDVGSHTHIDSSYDDSFGERTIEQVTNVEGKFYKLMNQPLIVSILPLSMICLLDFRTVPTVWYVLFFC